VTHQPLYWSVFSRLLRQTRGRLAQWDNFRVDISPRNDRTSSRTWLYIYIANLGFSAWYSMTYTQQKLMYSSIMLEQAKKSSNDYSVFMANLDAFVYDARSVTYIMQKEYNPAVGFEEWYRSKQEEMKVDPDFVLFKKLRVDTTHIRPFNASSKYTTSFPGGLTITGGKTVDIPLGKVDNRSNLVIDNETPVTINGESAADIKHSTTRNYFFADRPNEDAVALCETYFQKLQKLVIECHDRFKLS
jgi:hypothetical protein